MFCTHCGREIDDKAVICVHCGVATNNFNRPVPVSKINNAIGLGLGSFIISLVSLLLGAFTLLPAIGLTLGMVSLSNSEKKNKFGICGVVINCVVLFVWVLLWILAMLSVVLGW